MEKPFPIWQSMEVSSAYALWVRLPIPRVPELSDKEDWLTAGKKQSAQRYKDPDWDSLRAPILRWGREKTLGQWEKGENSKAERGVFSGGDKGWSGIAEPGSGVQGWVEENRSGAHRVLSGTPQLGGSRSSSPQQSSHGTLYSTAGGSACGNAPREAAAKPDPSLRKLGLPHPSPHPLQTPGARISLPDSQRERPQGLGMGQVGSCLGLHRPEQRDG